LSMTAESMTAPTSYTQRSPNPTTSRHSQTSPLLGAGARDPSPWDTLAPLSDARTPDARTWDQQHAHKSGTAPMVIGNGSDATSAVSNLRNSPSLPVSSSCAVARGPGFANGVPTIAPPACPASLDASGFTNGVPTVASPPRPGFANGMAGFTSSAAAARVPAKAPSLEPVAMTASPTRRTFSPVRLSVGGSMSPSPPATTAVLAPRTTTSPGRRAHGSMSPPNAAWPAEALQPFTCQVHSVPHCPCCKSPLPTSVIAAPVPPVVVHQWPWSQRHSIPAMHRYGR